jgi:hypothetical protein
MTGTLCDALHQGYLLASFDAQTYSRGSAYARNGHVLSIDIDDSGHQLAARVAGSRNEAYIARVRLAHSARSHRLEISSSCSCPMEHSCKHVIAALLAAIADRDSRPAFDRGAPERAGAGDPRVALWLRDLDATAETPAGGGEAVVYLLSTRPTRALQIELASSRPKADGSWGKPRLFTAEAVVAGQGRMLTPEDMQAARLLWGLDRHGSRHAAECIDAALRLALRTGRAFLARRRHAAAARFRASGRSRLDRVAQRRLAPGCMHRRGTGSYRIHQSCLDLRSRARRTRRVGVRPR